MDKQIVKSVAELNLEKKVGKEVSPLDAPIVLATLLNEIENLKNRVSLLEAKKVV